MNTETTDLLVKMGWIQGDKAMNIQAEYDYESGYWYAVNADTYDGLEDGNNTTGTGDSEYEAVEDLLDKHNDLDLFDKHEALINYYDNIKHKVDWHTLRLFMLLSNRVVNEMIKGE